MGASTQIFDIARGSIKGERSYTRKEVIEEIMTSTNVDIDRAQNGFNMMVQVGAIQQTIDPNLFYLGGSTPF